jgi:hypothetical protein
MDLEGAPWGKAFDLDYHMFDNVKLSPERYFEWGIVRHHELVQGMRPLRSRRYAEDSISNVGSKTLF